MNKGNTTKIEPVAEVRLGKYVARFTEEKLQDLHNLVNLANEGVKDTIHEYYDFCLEVWNNDHEKAEECMRAMDGLRGFIWWFDKIKNFDVKHEE